MTSQWFMLPPRGQAESSLQTPQACPPHGPASQAHSSDSMGQASGVRGRLEQRFLRRTRRFGSGLSPWTCCLVGALALGVLTQTGCSAPDPGKQAPALVSPYERRVVIAVAPLRNESGSRFADGLLIADALQRQLEQIDGVSTVPVNRVLAAMQQLGLEQLTTVDQAMALRATLGVDGLVAGTVSAYEPYPPPELGLMLDLYFDPQNPAYQGGFNARQATYAAVDEASRPLSFSAQWPSQPVSAVSGYYNAELDLTARQINAYAHGRQSAGRDWLAEDMLRLDMNRFSRFVSYAMAAQLVAAEHLRLDAQKAAQAEAAQQAAAEQQTTQAADNPSP